MSDEPLDLYEKFSVMSKLNLKGKKPKGEKKSKKRDRNEEENETVKLGEIIQGEGRITSNGTTVTGMETNFTTQLEFGDVIIVLHPKTLVNEEKVVTNIISQRTIQINEPFSADLISTVAFRIRKDSEAIQVQLESQSAEKKIKKEDLREAVQAHISSKGSSNVTYRVRQGDSYKTVTEVHQGSLSREQILDERTKKTRDKYCW